MTPEAERFAAAVAKDLSSAGKSRAVVIPGERQDPSVHALAFLINDLLGSLGQSVGTMPASLHYTTTNYQARNLASLVTDIEGGTVKRLVCLGTNPVYEAPGSLKLGDSLAKLETLVHAGYRNDETGQRATWHIPLSHELESWGDLESNEGIVSICQPQIEPLFDTPSALQVLARLVEPGSLQNGMTLVRKHWEQAVAASRRPLTEKVWRRWLHDGVATGVPRDARPASRGGFGELAALLAQRPAPVDSGIEVGFALDYDLRRSLRQQRLDAGAPGSAPSSSGTTPRSSARRSPERSGSPTGTWSASRSASSARRCRAGSCPVRPATP